MSAKTSDACNTMQAGTMPEYIWSIGLHQSAAYRQVPFTILNPHGLCPNDVTIRPLHATHDDR